MRDAATNEGVVLSDEERNIMGLFKGKPGEHGKADAKAAARASADKKMKEIAKHRPDGESARILKERDIRNWKEGRQ